MTNMRLGICTRYKQCEATQVAIRIADWAQQRGYEATLYTETRAPMRLGIPWDRDIQTNSKLKFTEWARSCSTVMWTHSPIPEQVAWVKKQGIRTAIISLWYELSEHDFPSLRESDLVISPSRCAAKHLTNNRIKHSIGIPWDVGLPFTQKDPRLTADRQWVLLPLYDQEPYNMEATCIEIAGRMLRACPQTVLTAAYSSSTLAPFARRRLNDFARCFGERVRLQPGVPLTYRPLLFQEHDLTLWPVHTVNTGMIGLTSLTMGTPVIAYDFPPTCEFLTADNAVIVPADGYSDCLGIPRIEPDYARFEDTLHHCLNTPDLLRNLQQRVLRGMPERRTLFREALSRVVR